MKQIPWFLNPVLIFVVSLVAVVISLVLFIHWSLRAKFGLESIVQRFNTSSDALLELNTWVTILTLSILVVVIIVGISIIYTYYQKTINLYRLQNNFINNFTHELKTPLTSINIFLETLKNHQVNRLEQLTYLDYMKVDANRLEQIINHILSTAKIESNSYRKNFELINIRTLVETVISGNPNFDNQIEIVMKDIDNFKFLGDRELLEMMISNLITNAIKYNNSPEPKLEITSSRESRYFTISFIDNGIGLDQEHLKRIFKKFYQAGDSLTTTAKGSGLGLFLAQMISQIHKCKIVARSDGLGKGSSFIFNCPLSKEIRSS